MRALKILVGVMTVLLVGGTALLVVLVVKRAGAPAVDPQARIALPAGSTLREVAGVGDRLVLRVADGSGAEALLLIDPRDGRALGRLPVITERTGDAATGDGQSAR